jgi:NADH-quinone oxidoreductase subunit L
MPSTSRTFWIPTLAIAGIPPLAGFFSKDEILAKTFFAGAEHSLYYLVWGVGAVTALLTAFYMTRLTWLTFNGTPRFDAEKHAPHESGWQMTLPLWILAALAVVGGFMGLPEVIGHLFHADLHVLGSYLSNSVTNRAIVLNEAVEWGLIALSIGIAVTGVLVARKMYSTQAIAADAKLEKSLGKLYTWMQGKFYFDELYDFLLVRPYERISRGLLQATDTYFIDGLVNFSGFLTNTLGAGLRRLQTGLLSSYLFFVTLGALGLMAYLLLG